MARSGLMGLDEHVATVCSNAIDHFATYVFDKSRLDPNNPYVKFYMHVRITVAFS